MVRSAQGSYRASRERVYTAVITTIAELGYSVKNSDPQSFVVSFNTGMSLWSWSGQDITVTVIPEESGSKVALAGGLAKTGTVLTGGQLYSWGEKDRVIARFLEALDRTVAATPESTMPESPSGPAGATAGATAELERLAELHARGALTDEEFASAKAKILAR